MEKKLQVRNLRVSFRTVSGKLQAVRDISFDLNKGETLAIVGESGSGKSVTSKAILGILAGNTIIEGGEILYDGQDLLKISEDDFYKIRGDKISMIFQDPLSSLNPIMRIGKQLTEAMLLKGKARQRAGKVAFKEGLQKLEKTLVEGNPNAEAKVREMCAQFEKFSHAQIALEKDYNEAYESAQEALTEIENILYLIEKNAFEDARTRLKEVQDFAKHSVNPYVVENASEIRCADDLTKNLSSKDFTATAKTLRTLQSALQKAVAKEKPNFAALGYAKSVNAPAAHGTQAEQNRQYEELYRRNFMDEFLDMLEKGMSATDTRYLHLREKALDALREGEKHWSEKFPENMKDVEALADTMMQAVKESINPMDVTKDSAAYTFSGSLKAFLENYREGLRTNGGKQRKYDRQVARRQRLTDKGKEPDWKVATPNIIDLNLVHDNVMLLIQRMKEHYQERNASEKNVDERQRAEQFIAYLRENASGMVNEMTRRKAKNKALKLLEEVGISEPRKRYKAYPFQFSGGMRQRIVIAIALAANPDILICDEPTTALDGTIQAQILELINKLKRERNLTIIFITHDLGVVANMADKIAVMYAGKIVEYGLSEEIFYSPAHPYTWALLSSMPDLETKEKLEAIPGTPPNMIYPPKGDAFAARNRYALNIDFEKQPPAFPITDTHWAATWLLHPDAPKLEPPKAVTDRIAKMKARMEAENNG